jgi:hypothetical protein
VTAAAAGEQLAHNLDNVSWIHRRSFNDDASYKDPIDKWYGDHVGDVPILGNLAGPKAKAPSQVDD